MVYRGLPDQNKEKGKEAEGGPMEEVLLSCPYNWRSGVVYRVEGKR